MTRLFTFGCSFTQYWRWPTWADYVGRGFDHYENWGLCGGGNSYIFNSLIECHQRNQINPGDQVLIMWTNTSREDRYVGDRWLEGGNVYWGTELGPDYVRRFACERGYLIRDLATMAAVKQLLTYWGCDWRWFSMVPFDRSNSDNELGENPAMPDQSNQDVCDLYRDVLDCMLPNVLDILLVEGALRWSWMLLSFSALSFLGFGVTPPTPDWGLMIADARTFLPIAPWAGLYPIAALSSLIIGINLAADALAKALGVDRAYKAPI